MSGKTRGAALGLWALAALGLAGCAVPAEGLYALPQVPERYARLEALVDERLGEGYEYAAPLDGSGQHLRLHDLDGDGEAEAVAFLTDADHMPAVCVYRLDQAGAYYLDAIIDGEGPAVASAAYADLDGDGADELLLCWRLDGGGGLLSAYRLTAQTHDSILSAACRAYYLCDLDGDGADELFVLDGGTLSRYAFTPEGGAAAEEAELSRGAGDVLRGRTGALSGGQAALFLDSRWGEDELITDVFAVLDGRLENLTAASGQSNTLRPGEAFSADIDGDGVTEIPEAAGDVLNWYALDAAGRRTLAATTCHDYGGGWYLTLDQTLAAGLSVSTEEESGRRAVTLSAADDSGQRREVAAIWVLTGEDRLDRAARDGGLVLAQDRDAVYAARLYEPALMTEQALREGFHLIYTDWRLTFS